MGMGLDVSTPRRWGVYFTFKVEVAGYSSLVSLTSLFLHLTMIV